MLGGEVGGGGGVPAPTWDEGLGVGDGVSGGVGSALVSTTRTLGKGVRGLTRDRVAINSSGDWGRHRIGGEREG